MKAPAPMKPTGLAGYLELISRAVFEAGMSWNVIENKWPGFREAFDGFDAETIASYGPDDIDRLLADTRIIRNHRKVEATVHNAKVLLDIETEYGSVGKYLEAMRPFESQAKDLQKRLKHFGNFGCYYFLYMIGEEVPPHEEYNAKLKRGAPSEQHLNF